MTQNAKFILRYTVVQIEINNNNNNNNKALYKFIKQTKTNVDFFEKFQVYSQHLNVCTMI